MPLNCGGLSLFLRKWKCEWIKSASNSRLTTQQERRIFLAPRLLRPALVKPSCKKEIPPGRSTPGWAVVKSSWLTGSSRSWPLLVWESKGETSANKNFPEYGQTKHTHGPQTLSILMSCISSACFSPNNWRVDLYRLTSFRCEVQAGNSCSWGHCFASFQSQKTGLEVRVCC